MYTESELKQKIEESRSKGVSEELINARVQQLRNSGKVRKTVEETRKSNKLPETIGGIGGGILGGLVGSVPGAIVGAAGGGGIGASLNDFAAQIAALRQRQKGTPENIGDLGGGFNESIKAAGRQGGYQALGEGLGGLLRFGAHPIKSVVDTMVVNPLKKS